MYLDYDVVSVIFLFAVLTLGPWGPDAWLLFKELSKRLIDETND